VWQSSYSLEDKDNNNYLIPETLGVFCFSPSIVSLSDIDGYIVDVGFTSFAMTTLKKIRRRVGHSHLAHSVHLPSSCDPNYLLISFIKKNTLLSYYFVNKLVLLYRSKKL